MTDPDRLAYARTVALQALYYAGQREKGRRLTSAEMAAAIRTTEGFLDWFFGDSAPGAGAEADGSAATSAGEARG